MAVYYIGSQSFGYNDLSHHGILGMKWGIRRFQNSDGTLTPEGKERYGSKYGITDHKPSRVERTIGSHMMKNRNLAQKTSNKAVRQMKKEMSNGNGRKYTMSKKVKNILDKAIDYEKIADIDRAALNNYSKLSDHDKEMLNGTAWIASRMGVLGTVSYSSVLSSLYKDAEIDDGKYEERKKNLEKWYNS